MGYLPRKDAELLAWSNNFKSQITPAPESLGLSVAQAASYATAQGDYQNAYSNAYNVSTRTRSTIELKDEKKRDLIELTQQLVRIVQACPTVTDDQRRDLMITVRKEPAPVPAPDFAPELDIVEVTGRIVKLRAHDEVLGRAKPPGCACLNVFTFMGENPPEETTSWQFQGQATKTVMTIPLPPGPATKLWIIGFWANRKGEFGPPCDPIQVNLAASTTPPITDAMKLAA